MFLSFLVCVYATCLGLMGLSVLGVHQYLVFACPWVIARVHVCLCARACVCAFISVHGVSVLGCHMDVHLCLVFSSVSVCVSGC